MGIGLLKYWLEVREAIDKTSITSGIYTFVYKAGTKTLATLYSSDTGVSLANPITTARHAIKDKIEFWTVETSVDIYVNNHTDGREAFLSSVTPTTHIVELPPKGVDSHFVVPFAPSNNAEVDTGVDIPYGTEIHRVAVEVVTVDATETLDVGLLSSETAGDANGLISLAPMDNAVLVKPWAITDGASEDYISGVYYGALMGLGSAGTNSANDFGQPGGAGHFVTGANAKSVTYTGTAGSDTAAGYIHIWGRLIR